MMPSANKYYFISLPQSVNLLFFFSCLITLAKVFSTMFKSSGKGEHLCFIPELVGKV